MTQEEKTLLLKDLCGRLPYKVKVHLEDVEHGELIGILDAVYPTDDRVIVDELNKAIANINVRCGGFRIEENKVKPYLRPMSSITEEELDEYEELEWAGDFVSLSIPLLDWLNKNMFDYRGLIEKGLAIEALEGTYNLKK